VSVLCSGVQVYTVDHEDASRLRLDLDVAWNDTAVPAPRTPDEEIVCDVEAGYICARDACSVMWWDSVQWWPTGEKTMLALQDDMLLEYSTATFAPAGMLLHLPLDASFGIHLLRCLAYLSELTSVQKAHRCRLLFTCCLYYVGLSNVSRSGLQTTMREKADNDEALQEWSRWMCKGSRYA
jgi:hypothetical protein